MYVNGRPVVIPDHTYLRGPGPRVVVRFPGPIGTTWANRLAKLGATVEFWCPPYGACVTMSGDAAEKLATSEIVTGYVPYEEAPYVTNPGADDGPADLGVGHGTYVAGLAAGNGAQRGDPSRPRRTSHRTVGQRRAWSSRDRRLALHTGRSTDRPPRAAHAGI